jgi:polyketide synthase 13
MTMDAHLSATELSDWMTKYVADFLGIDTSAVERTASFEAMGLDSAAVAGLAGDLSDLLRTELDATIVYDHNSIQALSLVLAGG